MIKKVFHNIIVILVLGQILALPNLPFSHEDSPKNNLLSYSKKVPSNDFGKLVSEISIFEEVEEDSADGENDDLLLFLNPQIHFSFLNKTASNKCFLINFLNLNKIGSKLFILHRKLRI